MKEATFSEIVKMDPWVGCDYEATTPKMLILGMSCYGGYATKNKVKNMISAIRNEKWTHSFFTKIINTFNSEEHWIHIEKNNYQLDRKIFWDSVAFYEYLQHVFDEPKENVPEKFWNEAKEPFLDIVNKLEPDIILVMGYKTYDHLPEIGKKYKDIKFKNEKMEVWEYDNNSKKTYICKIKHPSSGNGFKSYEWMKMFEKFKNEI